MATLDYDGLGLTLFVLKSLRSWKSPKILSNRKGNTAANKYPVTKAKRLQRRVIEMISSGEGSSEK